MGEVAAEFKINVEHKAGVLLKEMNLRRGRKSSRDESVSLEDLGINYNQSHLVGAREQGSKQTRLAPAFRVLLLI